MEQPYVCECCGRDDLPLGGWCGFGPICGPCYVGLVSAEDTEEHAARHMEAPVTVNGGSER